MMVVFRLDKKIETVRNLLVSNQAVWFKPLQVGKQKL